MPPNFISSGTLPSPANYLCYAGQGVAGDNVSVLDGISNPQQCNDQCSNTPGCAAAVFDYNGQCTLSNNSFVGSQDSNAQDPSIIEACLAAPGAPDTSEEFAGN